MIPTDIISINLSIITVSCIFWGVVWKLFLKEKISVYNQIIEESKIKILEDFNKQYTNANATESKIETLKDTSKKIEKIQEKKIEPESINRYLFWIVILSVVSIIVKFVEPLNGGIMTGNITYSQTYEGLTLGSVIILVIFVDLNYKTNKKFSTCTSTDSIMKTIQDEVREE